MEPTAEQCYSAGNVPVPNLGWFCSQACAVAFEGKNGVKFERNQNGEINYYESL